MENQSQEIPGVNLSRIIDGEYGSREHREWTRQANSLALQARQSYGPTIVVMTECSSRMASSLEKPDLESEAYQVRSA